jgi:hypothetical protein
MPTSIQRPNRFGKSDKIDKDKITPATTIVTGDVDVEAAFGSFQSISQFPRYLD